MNSRGMEGCVPDSDSEGEKGSLGCVYHVPALKSSSSATKFRNENELFEWLRPPTEAVEAGMLLSSGIVCTVDEGMMGL